MDDSAKGNTTTTTELEEEVQEPASEAKEGVGGVLQVIVLGGVCAGFLAIIVGVFLLAAAII